MKYYIDNQNQVFAYESDGSQDHLIGDKVAMTAAEIDAHINPPKTALEIYYEKWGLINQQIEALTVTIAANGHKYAADDAGVSAIARKILSISPTDVVWWSEKWGSFQTNKVELEEVLITAEALRQAIHDQIMGV